MRQVKGQSLACEFQTMGNFFRIRSAFGYGARKLARILECPKEKLNTELDHFFPNTWDRHGSRRRPDVPVPVNQTQQRSMLGPPLSTNSIVSPKYKKERTSEIHADVAESKGIRELSSSSLSAEAEVLRSALQHVTKTIREVNATGEDSNKVTESTVASTLSKGTKHEFVHGSELPRSRVDDSYQGKENTTQMDELSLQRGFRTQREESSKMEQIAISAGSKRAGNSEYAGNIEQPSLKVPLARSTRSDSQFAVTSKVLASAGSTIRTVPAVRSVEASWNPIMKEKTEEESNKETYHSKGPLITISAQHSKNEDFAPVESKDPSAPHHEVLKSVSRTGSQKFCSALPTCFAHVPSVTQQNQFSLHLQSSVTLPLPHQENLVSPPALGVSSGHTNTSSSMSVSSGLGSGHGVASYVSFSLPRGPVPPPLPPYMGFVGLPSPHLFPMSEDPIPPSNQFPSFLPRMDEVLQQQDHNLWPQSEQVHELHGVHLASSTPNTTHAAASLVRTPPQLAVSQAFPSPTAISPVSSFPVSGALRPVGPASLNSPTFYLNNNNSFPEFATEIEDTTAGRHSFPLENAEVNVTALVQERTGTGSLSSKRGTESELDVVGKASERLVKAANDKAFSRGKEVSNEEVSESVRGEDGYVVSYGEEPMYFPTQTGYGHTLLSLPGYSHVFPSAGSVSGPMMYPNALQPIFSQTNVYSGTTVAAESPVLVPYPPFSSQVASVSSVSPIPAPRQHSSLSGVSANGPAKSLRPSGSEQTAPAVSLFRSQRSMESPGASPSTYLHVPYIAVHNSFPVYVLPPNFDGTSGLDMSDSLQPNNNLGAVNEFGVEIFDDTQMKLNSRLTYGVGERLLASGVAVSAGSQLQAFPLDGNFEATFQDSRFDPLCTDFAGHLRNLDYGRICQNPQVLIPVLNQPPILHPSPKYLQGHYPWEGPGRPLQSTINLGGHAVRSGHGYVPVSSTVLNFGHNTGGYHIISGTASSSGEEAQRTRSGTGTGTVTGTSTSTYWSSPRQNFSRDTQASGRNISGTHSQYHGERDGGQTFAPRHRNTGRVHTRFEGRSSSYMTNENSISEEKVTQRVRLMSMQDSLGISPMQAYPGVRASSVSAVPAGTVLTPTMAMSLEMLPQLYMNNNAVLGAAGANVPPVLVVYPYGNAMEFASESLEFGSLGMLQSAAPQADNEREGHVIGRSNLIRSQKPAYVTIPSGSISIPTFSSEVYLQPTSPSYQQRSFHHTYQLKEEDFPPLSFGS